MGKWRFEFSENGLRGSVGQCWVRLGVSAWAGQVARVLPPSRGASGRGGNRNHDTTTGRPTLGLVSTVLLRIHA